MRFPHGILVFYHSGDHPVLGFLAVEEVDGHFSGFHAELAHLRSGLAYQSSQV